MSEQTSLGDYTADDEGDGETPDPVPDEAERAEFGGGEIYVWDPDGVEDDEEEVDEGEDEDDGEESGPSVTWERMDDGGVRIIHDGEAVLEVGEESLGEDTYVAYTEDGWAILDENPVEEGPSTGPSVPTWTRDEHGDVRSRAHRNHRKTLRRHHIGSYHDGETGFPPSRLGRPIPTMMVLIVEADWGLANPPGAASIRGDVLDERVD